MDGRLTRFALVAALSAIGAAAFASSAAATYHENMIREVHEGVASVGDYVELQAFAPGQNFVAGKHIVSYDAGGGATPLTDYTIPSNVTNGANQATILIANTAMVNGVPADFVTGPGSTGPGNLNVDNTGGTVCYTDSSISVPLDCVAFEGTMNPVTVPAAAQFGTPFALPGANLDGQSLIRTISRGCATSLTPPMTPTARRTSASGPGARGTTPPLPRRRPVRPPPPPPRPRRSARRRSTARPRRQRRKSARKRRGTEEDRVHRKLTRTALITGVALVVAGPLPAAASADTVTIGSPLSHPNTPALSTGAIGVQAGASAGLSTFPFLSPATGTVTGWSVRTADSGAVYGLRVLRPAGGTLYTSVGASGLAPATPSSSDATYHFATSLPIIKGDAIGISVDSGHDLPQYTTTNMQDVLEYAPTFPNGNTQTFTNIGGLHELLLQATVKFCNVPNVHKLKKVLAKTALTNGDCGVRVKKKDTNKKKFRGKVLKQKVAVGTTGAPGLVVPIVIGTK